MKWQVSGWKDEEERNFKLLSIPIFINVYFCTDFLVGGGKGWVEYSQTWLIEVLFFFFRKQYLQVTTKATWIIGKLVPISWPVPPPPTSPVGLCLVSRVGGRWSQFFFRYYYFSCGVARYQYYRTHVVSVFLFWSKSAGGSTSNCVHCQHARGEREREREKVIHSWFLSHIFLGWWWCRWRDFLSCLSEDSLGVVGRRWMTF